MELDLVGHTRYITVSHFLIHVWLCSLIEYCFEESKTVVSL